MSEAANGATRPPDGFPRPANAAPDAPRRNRPRFEDLPVPDDTANLREGPDLHAQCSGLLPLIGVWRGVGEAVYPTIDGPYRFGQQIVFAHDGRPFFHYLSRSWITDDEGNQVRPAAIETGFIRAKPENRFEFVLAHSSGIVEVWYGEVDGPKLEMTTDAVVRTETAKEYVAGHRLYGLVDGDLLWTFDMAAMGQPLQPHIWARLQRAA